MIRNPSPSTITRLACTVALVAGVVLLSGCVSSASSRWAQNAPTIKPIRQADVVALGGWGPGESRNVAVADTAR